MDGHDPVEEHWWYPDDYPGDAVTVAAADAGDNLLDMFSNSTEDLFELVWEGGSTGQPTLSRLRSPPRATAPIVPPPDPAPSEDVMASWLYPIVSGLDHAGDSSKVLARVKSEPSVAKGSFGTMTKDECKGKIPATDEEMTDPNSTKMRSNFSERRKAASEGSSRTRSSQHSVTHNSTERRRRCKISDRLRTLQQLVPGCDKSNQASTLEQTIQYLNLLQQQVQSMNMRPAASAAAAVYPVMQPPMPIPATAAGQAQPGTVVPMVPYGAMIPYAHYHAMMMSAAASAVPVMVPAPAASAAPGGAVLPFHGAATAEE